MLRGGFMAFFVTPAVTCKIVGKQPGKTKCRIVLPKCFVVFPKSFVVLRKCFLILPPVGLLNRGKPACGRLSPMSL